MSSRRSASPTAQRHVRTPRHLVPQHRARPAQGSSVEIRRSLMYTVDWTGHNIETWERTFGAAGWLRNSTPGLAVLEVRLGH